MPTEVIHSVGVGQDYTLMSAWEAAEGRDLVALDEIDIVEIHGDVDAVYPALDINGFNTDATRRIIIRAAAGQEFDALTMTGARLVNTSSGSYGIVNRSGSLVTLNNLGVNFDGVGNYTLFNGAPAGCLAEDCVFYGTSGSVRLSANNVWTLRKCLVLPEVGNTGGSGNIPYQVFMEQCTVIATIGKGAWASNIQVYQGTSIDTVVYNENPKTSYDSYFQSTDTFCAQNDNGSAANVAINTVTKADFVDFDNGDYRLASGSQLIGAGSTGNDIGAFGVAGVAPVTGLSITSDKVFDPLASIHVQFMGAVGEVLNLTNINGGNASIGSTPNGGTINFINPAQLTITELDNPTEVRVFIAGTQTEVAGQEVVSSGSFSTSIGVPFVDVTLLSLTQKYRHFKNINMSSDFVLPSGQSFDPNYRNDP